MENYLSILEKYNDILVKKEKDEYYSLLSSLTVLKQFHSIKNSYLKETNLENDFLINLFGLLQALFVSIDGLYRISNLITKRKWSVNINLNPVLREIKHIRNDVVGHPNNRIYNDDVGFCLIDFDKSSYYELYYDSYIYKKDILISNNHKVDIKIIIDNYFYESTRLLNEIYSKYHIDPKSFISMSSLIKDLYNDINNLSKIDKVKTIYINQYKLFEDSNDRFIWRLNLIKELNVFKEKNLYKDIIDYAKIQQLKRVYKMACENDFDRNLKIEKFKIKNLSLPFILKDLKKTLIYNRIKPNYLNNIEDSTHYYFNNLVKNLIDLSNNKDVINFLNWYIKLAEDSKNSNIVYSIGYVLKRLI